MRNLYIIDKSIDITAKEKYDLSIQLSLDGFSFSIKETLNNKIVALAEYLFSPLVRQSVDELDVEIRKIFNSETLLKNKNYKTVNFVYLTDKQTLIPEEFYDPSTLKTLFTTQNEINEDEEILSNYIEHDKAYLIFAFPGAISHFLFKEFPNINIYHQSAIIINKNMANQPNQNTLIAINSKNSQTTFVLKQGNNTILANTYTTINPDDVLYYMSAIIENFNLKECLIFVNSQKGDVIFDKISKQIKVNTIPFDTELKFQKNISTKELLKNYNIL